MIRIGTYGAMQTYLSRLMQMETQLHSDQMQVSTGLKSQTYSGISGNVTSLISTENSDAGLKQYLSDNSTATTTITAMTTSIGAVQKSVSDFESQLTSFQMSGQTDPQNVASIQQYAFQTLQDISDYLSSSLGGQYLFSGGRVDTRPVQLQASDLASFQSMYDGSNHTVGTVPAAQLLNYTTSPSITGAITFDPVNGVIQAANPGALAKFVAGSTFTVSNSASNNTNFTVTRQAMTNNAGALLTAGSDSGAQITLGTGAQINEGTTGGLTFAVSPQGMTMTAATPTALAQMLPGMTFTISHDTASASTGAYDGTYTVVSNTNGTVTIQNDSNQFTAEAASNATVSLDTPGGAGDGYGDSPQPLSGPLFFKMDPNNQGILMSPSAAADTANIAGGDEITITGTADHNGSYKVLSKNADGSLVLAVSSPALQVSKFTPQVGRTDVSVEGVVGNTSNPYTTQSFTAANYGSLSFDPNGAGGETITAANANAFTDSSGAPFPPAGAVINLSSTSGVNDGGYNVVSNDGTHIVIQSTRVTNEVASTTAQLTSTSWYQGDTLQLQQQVDSNRIMNVAVTAADPGFERAIRALEIIAQGKYGTAGGLDNHPERVTAALYLLADSKQSPASGTPPYGTEAPADMSTASSTLANTLNVMNNDNTQMTNLSASLEERISNIANADPTQAITMLMHDSTALQASYQAMAKVQNLSLLDYLK